MAFHDVRFPDNISRGARGGPSRRTQIVELASGAEERNASWADSRRRYDCSYGIRRADDLAAVVAFFEARNGRLHGFRFKDWSDYKSCLPSETPSNVDQVIGIGDAAMVEFQLLKLYTSGGVSWARAIEKPVAGSVVIAVNSIETVTGWTLDAGTGVVTFGVAPADGAVVTAGFQYDVPVRFDSDDLDVTLRLENLGSITSITLIEIRKRADVVVVVPPVVPEPPLDPRPIYVWSDIFTDHSATPVFGDNDAGADWTGWGANYATLAEREKPAHIPLEWFMQNVLANDAPTGAILDLTSPTGEIFYDGRMQPPGTSRARNITLDLTGNVIKRGGSGSDFGVMFIWGEPVNDPALASAATVGVDAAEGDFVIFLNDPDADTESLLGAAAAGAIIEIRTNTTRAGYHPEESRARLFVASVDATAKSITFVDPLPLDVPVSNPIGDFESSDPSTLVLLQGSLLTANAPAGATTIVMASAAGLSIGDWLVVGTNEIPGFDAGGNGLNQFYDGFAGAFAVSPDLDVDVNEDFGGTPVAINEETHQIASISGNVVMLTGALGKNKLLRWQCYAYKVDVIEGFEMVGGSFVGQSNHGGASAWHHQYIWARFCINSIFRDMQFDWDDAITNRQLRRTGQAVRCDNGDNNLIDNLDIGYPGSVDAGEGYGVSLRKGERNSTISNCYFTGCRHSIEFWSTSGGCVAEDNHAANDTSSSIDTHGNWNTGIIIRNNLVSRDRDIAGISGDTGNGTGDLDNATDAIRIGNNKFIWDENIQVLNNRVIGYDGNALSLVPGVFDVTVDGLEVDGCWRILNLKNNARHPDTFLRNCQILNVTAKNIRDRWIDIRHNIQGAPVSGVNYNRRVADDLLLKNWTIGADGPTGRPDIPEPGAVVTGMQFLHCNGLVLENFTITGANVTNSEWFVFLQEIDDVSFINWTIEVLPDTSGGDMDQFLYVKNATNIRGAITLTGLNVEQAEPGDPFLAYFNDGSGTASTTDTALTITHDLGPSPKVINGPPAGFTLNLVQV